MSRIPQNEETMMNIIFSIFELVISCLLVCIIAGHILFSVPAIEEFVKRLNVDEGIKAAIIGYITSLRFLIEPRVVGHFSPFLAICVWSPLAEEVVRDSTSAFVMMTVLEYGPKVEFLVNAIQLGHVNSQCVGVICSLLLHAASYVAYYVDPSFKCLMARVGVHFIWNVGTVMLGYTVLPGSAVTTRKGLVRALREQCLKNRERKKEQEVVIKPKVVHNLGKRSWINDYRTPCGNFKNGKIVTLPSLSKGNDRNHAVTQMFSGFVPSIPLKVDDNQFDAFSKLAEQVMSKGVDVNIKTGLSDMFKSASVPSSITGMTSSVDVQGILGLLDITDDLPGLCKAVIYIYGLGMIRKRMESKTGDALFIMASSGVLYRVFTKFEIYSKLDALMNLCMRDPPSDEEVTTQAGVGFLDAVNAIFIAYFTAGALDSRSVSDFTMKLGKAKSSMTGVTFGLKTLNEYLTYVLNFFLGSDDALINGDANLTFITDQINSALVLLKVEGSVFKGLQVLSDCKVKLTQYRLDILKNNELTNKSQLTTVVTEMLNKINDLAMKYDTTIADGLASRRMLLVTLGGPSRIGKSMLISELAQSAVLHLNKDRPDNFDALLSQPELYIKTLKTDATFIDMAENPEVLIVDDLDVARQVTGEPMSELQGLMFQSGTGKAPRVDGAAVHTKDLKVSAKILIAATNVTGETQKNIAKTRFNYPKAWYNRQNPGFYCAFVRKTHALNPDAKPWDRVVDPDKMIPHDDDSQHLYVVKTDFFTDEPSGHHMSSREWINLILSKMDERAAEHHVRAKGYRDSMLKKMLILKPDYKAPEYLNPDELVAKLREKYSMTEEAAMNVKKGWIEKNYPNVVTTIEEYVAYTLGLAGMEVSVGLKDILSRAGKFIFGYRREILAAVTILASYRVMVSLSDWLFSAPTTESGKPKLIKAKARMLNKFTNSARVAENATTEAGTVDATTLSVMNKVLKNSFKLFISVPSVDGTSTSYPVAYGFQSQKTIFMPRHYLSKIDAFLETSPDCQMVLMFDTGKSYKLSASDFDDSKLFTGTSTNCDDDLVSLYVDSAPPKADLSDKFMSEDELLRLSRKGDFSVAYGETSYVKDTTMTYRVISMVKSAFSNRPIVSRDDLGGGVYSEDVYTVSRSINTQTVVTSEGLCGSLYFVDGKILAMHAAITAKSSVGLVLSRRDVEGHVAWHASRGKMAISESEPTLEALKSGALTQAQMTHVIGVIPCSVPRRAGKTTPGPFYEVAVDPDIGLKGSYEVMDLSLSRQHACLEGRPQVIEAVNGDRLERCIGERKRSMASAVSNAMECRSMTKLTLDEAVNGVDDITGMARSTSMGFMSASHGVFGLPKGITKLSYLGEPLCFGSSKYYNHCHDRVNKLLDNLKKGVINYDENPDLYVLALPKDEARKVGKNTRMVYCYTPVLNAVIIMYFARCVSLYKAVGLQSNVAYINPFAQADHMLMHLVGGDQKGEVVGIDLDFAAWDILLHPTFFCAALRHIASYASYTGEDAIVVETLINIIARPSVVVALNSSQGVVMKMNAGLASGSPLTSVGNSVANDLLVTYGVSTSGHHLDVMCDDEEGRSDQVRVVTHGDDLMVVPSQLMLDQGFNYSTLAKVMFDLGMRPQPISKDGVIVETRHLIARDIDDTTSLEFLCRNFVRVNGVLKLANKNETNAKQLLFQGPEFDSLSKEDKESRWNEFFVELSQRGCEYYDRYRVKMAPIFIKLGLSPRCAESYNACLLHKDKVIQDMLWV